ncbi:uncharacterized protein GGS25DRAFT_526202 [Hypoxylon fragiforme]|uniref:uncharacterized protein n=1 Tax=Hypoxylon fragiforme TaxID=63214 RepID=UPI0020C5CADE|nr:uncharacterized protein GGS25DRAFT_526202 [Hypoxylon fragiforme]KAI2603161.1 hypothetical protein GGS25DRAFT_526202 [Hypoxylon fragiforme]
MDDIAPPRRPNGRLQACDPCRKRKLACDHTQPICGRCTKRKQESECVYLSTGPKRPRSRSPLPSPTSSAQLSSSTRHEPHRLSQSTPAVRPDAQAPGSIGTGYLGPTSYCHVYDSLSLLHGSEGIVSPQSENTTHPTPAVEAAQQHSQSHLSVRVRDMALTVLRNVPDPVRGTRLLLSFKNDGWDRMVTLRLVQSFYSTFGHYFSSPPPSVDRRDFEAVIQTLCTNTARPFTDDEPDPERWYAQFSGANMRWESLGMLSIYWQFVPGSDRGAWNAKRSAEFDRNFGIARENLRLCVELCKEFSAGNTLMVYLSQKCTAVDSMLVGDADLLVWRSHAEAMALVTFLGFHVLEERDRHRVSFMSEIKKSLYHHMYAMAQLLVSFTGRPPMMSRRFASAPLPLDIGAEYLFAGHDDLVKAIERLDEKGWNTDGKMHFFTRIRARSILAAIREEIFEIALSNEQVASIETLLKLRDRELQAVSEFPSCIQFNPLDLEDQTVPMLTVSARLFLQQEHLQNMFFVDRLLLRYGYEDKGDLLKISYDLVTLTLPRFAAFRNDAEWLVMAYAVPAGGILCLELLKPSLHVKFPNDPKITRSNIIQKLSLLVAYLDWVGPSGVNGALCSDAKSIIQRVLDQTLNAASSVYEQPTVFEWDPPTQLDFNFDLLDTFNWNRPDFPSSQQSNQ